MPINFIIYLYLCSFNSLILYKNKNISYYNYKFKASTCLNRVICLSWLFHYIPCIHFASLKMHKHLRSSP